MRYRNFEANYLISLISATLNQRMAPAPVRAIEWRELFYLAEYHEVTNIAYYSLIGFYDQIPETWKERFSKIFRKWVAAQALVDKEMQTIQDTLEDHGIDYVILKDWNMKRYYPQPDMRVVEDVKFLIKPKDYKGLKKIMRDIGYRAEELDHNQTTAFYKSVRCRFIFYQKLFADNPKIAPYYTKVWKKLKSAVGFGKRYDFGLDDSYIFMISDICNEYARGDIDARHIIDLYLFLKKNKEQLNPVYIENELSKLELYKMSKCLEDVSSLWFGVYEGDGTWQCKDVEEYIWSKGAYGRETSIQLMPMLVDLEIWRIRDARKKKIINMIRWVFPKLEYMQGKYAAVRKCSALLPLFWIFRILAMAAFFVKLKIRAFKRMVFTKTNGIDMVQKKPE